MSTTAALNVLLFLIPVALFAVAFGRRLDPQRKTSRARLWAAFAIGLATSVLGYVVTELEGWKDFHLSAFVSLAITLAASIPHRVQRTATGPLTARSRCRAASGFSLRRSSRTRYWKSSVSAVALRRDLSPTPPARHATRARSPFSAAETRASLASVGRLGCVRVLAALAPKNAKPETGPQRRYSGCRLGLAGRRRPAELREGVR